MTNDYPTFTPEPKRKVAIYPGSFNPWHEGHEDILEKALKVFDRVIIAQGINPDKKISEVRAPSSALYGKFPGRIQMAKFTGLLVDFIKQHPEFQISAVIRGLRDGKDLDFERVQQYWNEDLGIEVPTVYFVCHRSLVHVSSSAIKMVQTFRKPD